MKKIGTVFMLFGFFFPMILAIFTDFGEARYSRGIPISKGLIENIQSGRFVIFYNWVPYSYALAFSIVVFAVGIGFLLLSEPRKKGGGSFR